MAEPSGNPAPLEHQFPEPVDPRVRQVEIIISYLLRFGGIISLAVVVLGICLSFYHHQDYFSSKDAYRHLISYGAPFPHTIRESLKGALQWRGRCIAVLGLLLLAATPVLCVAVSIFAFVHQRDRKFVIITSIVLLLLLISFMLGKGGG